MEAEDINIEEETEEGKDNDGQEETRGDRKVVANEVEADKAVQQEKGGSGEDRLGMFFPPWFLPGGKYR